MSLAPGTRLGPYEIQAPLGAGGMGEVYRARDTRLDRAVAIKVLPAHLSEDTALRERFEREARAVSSLNHPHICVLHDIGRHETVDYLVMEYLEGETLSDRLARGPLPLAELLRCAQEIASALAQAHRSGVVHRDLKPGNVMLTRTGAKLLDFGLAKLGRAGIFAAGASAVATLTRPLTSEGTLVGTLQYMAPEQLEGKEADPRSDIFAFGAMLYEMATGRKAFEAKTHATLIGAILHAEPPPVSTIQPVAPAGLDRIIRSCLAKDPDARRQSAQDLLIDLRWLAEGREPESTPPPAPPRGRRVWIATTVALLVLTAALALMLWFRSPTAPLLVRFPLSPAPGSVFQNPLNGGMAASPDGRAIVFVGGVPGGRRLYLRALDGLEARALDGTDDASFPFWAPNSRSIGFFAQGKLKRVDLAGGVQTVCPVPSPAGGGWAPDGSIVFASGGTLMRVSASGGSPTPFTRLQPEGGERSHAWPQVLPDGRVLYIGATGSGAHVWLVRPDGTHPQRFEPQTRFARLAFAGGRAYLLYMRQSALMAQRVDPRSLQPAGEAVMLGDEISRSNTTGVADFSAAGAGLLVFRVFNSVGAGLEIRLVDRAGKPVRDKLRGLTSHVEFSPDGKRISGDSPDAGSLSGDVYVADLARGVISRFTFDAARDWVSGWSPDGKWIYFTSVRGDAQGRFQIYRKNAAGVGPDELVLKTDQNKHHFDISPDGKTMIFESQAADGRYDLWTLPLDAADRKPLLYLQSPFAEAQPRFSPDGKWIAYISDESGRFEVYVQSFPAGRGKFQVSTAGGIQPRWRRNGRELIYLTADGKIVSVDVDLRGGSFQAGLPKPLFETALSGTSTTVHYAMNAEATVFAVPAAAGDREQPPATVVLNWTQVFSRD